MGRREEYLESDNHWNSELSRQERLERWWPLPSFGIGLSGKAARAIGASQSAVLVADAARSAVEHQAVFALLDEGHTVRAIADQLGLSKSRVGRITKSIQGSDQVTTINRSILTSDSDAAREQILAAWGFEDLDSATRDHPRGTHEPSEGHGPTNFGGTNAPWA